MKPCTYCGVPAEGTDHTIPRSVVQAAGDAGVDLSELSRIRYVVVPCCSQCNAILGTKIFPNIQERREHVHSRLRVLHQADLAMPDWSEEEIADMGPLAQQDIRAGLCRRELVRKRLAWREPPAVDESFQVGYRLRLATVRKIGF